MLINKELCKVAERQAFIPWTQEVNLLQPDLVGAISYLLDGCLSHLGMDVRPLICFKLM